MTRSGWLLAALGVGLVGIGRAFGLLEMYVLGAVALALVVSAVIRVRRPLTRIEAVRTVSPRYLHVGGQARVDLEVTNRSGRRSPVLVLRDPIAGTPGARLALVPLDPGGKQSATYRLPADRRGLLSIGPLDAVVADPFGLAERRWRLTGQAELTVLPLVEPLHGPVPGGGLDDPLAGVTHHMIGSSGDDDFSTLRPYVVGDDLRRVHWATSARSDELVVRQDDPPWQGHLTMLLDGRTDHLDGPTFELTVSATASLVHTVAVRGDRARLLMTDGYDSGLTDARANRDLLLEKLALIERHPPAAWPEPPVDGRSRTGGLVVLTGPARGDALAFAAAQRAHFASVTLVTIDIDPSRRGTTIPGGSVAPGVNLVIVDDRTSFAAAWAGLHGRGLASRGRWVPAGTSSAVGGRR